PTARPTPEPPSRSRAGGGGRSGDEQGDEPRAGRDEGAGELDEDRQSRGLHRGHRRAPRGPRLTPPEVLREEHGEQEAENEADDGDHEEADHATEPTPPQGRARHVRLRQVPRGEEVLPDVRADDGDRRDREHDPGGWPPGHEGPHEDRAEHEERAGQHLDHHAEQADEDHEPDEELCTTAHGASVSQRAALATYQRTATATLTTTSPAIPPRYPAETDSLRLP